jgi:hypothetical protein
MLQNRSVAQEGGIEKNWFKVLDKYGVQFLILDTHDDADLLDLIQSQPEWQVDTKDEEMVVFSRVEAAQVYN